jgi:predicted transcriptional regulator
MSTTTIRVSTKIRDTLDELAQNTGLSTQQLLEQALEAYRRQRLLQEANAAYEALAADPQAWRDFQQELSDWNETVADGLESF